MKIRQLLPLVVTAGALAGWSAGALADSAAAKAKFESICSECHEIADFEGEAAADIEATLKKIVAKQMKHKKALTLTDQEVKDVAAFLAAGGK